jgi:hypothetical protein
MTLAEIQARVRYLSKKEAEDKLSSLILGAIAAQGDKKSIEKVSADLRKALT